MAIIKRIEPLSLAKITGIIYACLGLVGGILSFLLAILKIRQEAGPVVGIMAIFIMPLIYGGLGFIFGGITAFVFNITTKYIGGLEVDIE